MDELESPVEEVRGAHSDLVHCLAGAGGRLVTGGREGVVKVWDRRDLRQSVLSVAGEAREGASRPEVWAVDAGEDGDSLCAGYSNGDVRLFDCRAGRVRWESCLPKGVSSLQLLSGERLVAGSVGGSLVLWDLSSDRRTEVRLDSSTVWSAVTSPHSESLLAACLGSGSIQLLSLSQENISSLSSHQATDRPLTSWHWSTDKPGLAVTTGFDQNIRVVIVTNIER